LAYQLSFHRNVNFSLLRQPIEAEKQAFLASQLFPKQAFCFFRQQTVHYCRTSDPPSALGVLTTHKMAPAAAMPPHFAAARNLYSFAQTLMRLLFWHLTDS
jgi:hypothetical protein